MPNDLAARYFSCRVSVTRLRLTQETDAPDLLVPQRCKTPIVCGPCAAIEGNQRAYFQRRRIASISLQKDDDGRNVAVGYHLVWSVPRFLAPLLKSQRGLAAFYAAIAQATADTWGTRTGGLTKAETRAWWARHGAIYNFHPTGARQPTFLGWHPHADGFLSAHEFTDQTRTKIQRMADAWPSSYERTRNRYRIALRRFMKPVLAQEGPKLLGAEAMLEAYATLATDFKVNFFAVPKTEWGRTRHIREGAELGFEYSTRPHYNGSLAVLSQRDDGQRVFVYRTQGTDGTVHYLDPAEAARTILSLREHLVGETSHMHGYFAKGAYTRACKTLGVTPVTARPKRGKYQRIGEYRRDREGWFSNPQRGYFGEV